MQTSMQTAPIPLTASRTALWIGSIFGCFVLLFLLLDAAIRLMVR